MQFTGKYSFNFGLKLRLAPEFEEIVAIFDWPGDNDDVKLGYIKQFRREYILHHKLYDYAMIFSHS